MTTQGSKVILNMRGGYKIEADLSRNLATLPNSPSPLPFSFHRKIHDPNTAKLIDAPSFNKDGARFHLIQTTLPFFSGDRQYTVPQNGKSLSDIANSYRIPLSAVASYNSIAENSVLNNGDLINIPGGLSTRASLVFYG